MSRSDADELFMRRALELAEHGRGAVEPNPLVGAVVVREGQVVGEGWHGRFGGPHAEVVALEQAGERARGATLYVTLEPCCHQGKTPPCTRRIIEAGISKVVAAMIDPFTEVSGQGIQHIQDAGLTVVCGVLESEARRLNAPYLKLLKTGLPYVHAKWAMSLDGKIATATGDSRWISGEESRRRAHQLRGQMDAILVGLGTVRSDDPLLTARPPGPRTPVRIVLDSQARLRLSSQLVRTAREVPVIVAATAEARDSDIARLREAGCECLILEPDSGGPAGTQRRAPCATRTPIVPLLREMGRRRMTNVLIEGGAGVLTSFFEADQVDAVHIFLGAKLLGGAGGKAPLEGRGVLRVEAAPSFAVREVCRLGSDVYIRAERPISESAG